MSQFIVVLVISMFLLAGCDIDRYDRTLVGRKGVRVLPMQFLEGRYHYFSQPESVGQWLGEVRIRKASAAERVSHLWHHLELPRRDYVFEIHHGNHQTGELSHTESYPAQLLKIKHQYFLEFHTLHGLLLVKLNWTHYGLLFRTQTFLREEAEPALPLKKYADALHRSNVHIARVENVPLDDLLESLRSKPPSKLLVSVDNDHSHFDFMADSLHEIKPARNGEYTAPKVIYRKRCRSLF